ncbi:hypothetical protein NYF20_01070 [Lactobacillus delbrueckii]|uniref:hypothetical protein n=1 Tax=Lactobacillus delbrueckii TaxID=1584 RepID=UPI0039C33139
MSSILDDQLRLMALKQYGLIKSIKAPDISDADLTLILKNTENETIEQLATEKLIKSIKTPDISEADLTFILKNTENETIKQLATEKLQHLNSQAIQNNLNLIHKFGDNWKGWATSIARRQSINELKKRYKNASPDEKVKILDILYNAN